MLLRSTGIVLGLIIALSLARPTTAQEKPFTTAVFLGANYPGAPTYLPNHPWVGASLLIPVIWRLDFYPAVEIHDTPAEGSAIRTLMAFRVRPFADHVPLYAGAGVLAHTEGMAPSYFAGVEPAVAVPVRLFGETRLRVNPTFLDLVVGFRFR